MNRSIIKTVFTITFLFLVTACSHPLEISGEGDILSASGERTCLLEEFQAAQDNCRENYAVFEYEETYYATPRAGWYFDRWENYCKGAATNECSFLIRVDVVRFAWGAIVAPLRAVFLKNGSIPSSEFVNVAGREWVQPSLFVDVSYEEIAAVCGGSVCSGTLQGYLMDGWTWSSSEDVVGLLNGFTSSACPTTPCAVAGPGNWILGATDAGLRITGAWAGGIVMHLQGYTSAPFDFSYGGIATDASNAFSCMAVGWAGPLGEGCNDPDDPYQLGGWFHRDP